MSNLVSFQGSEAVTTSLAIAEGVGNPHKSVIQLIRQNISDLEEFGGVAFEMRPFETAGGTQNRECAILNEQQATLLLTYMRNNDTVRFFKKRLVHAFYELVREKFKQDCSPEMQMAQGLIAAQHLIEEKVKQIEVQKEKIKVLEPKAEFHDKVVKSHDTISVGEAAKILGTGQKRLFAFLRESGWVSRRNEPYQAKIESGYMDVKLSNFNHPVTGLQKSVTALVTGKGLAKLQKIWRERDLARVM